MIDQFATIQDNILAPTLEPLLEANGGVAIRDAFDRLHAMRFRAVQLSGTLSGLRARDLDASARRDLVATLRRREIHIAGLDLWIPPRHFLDSSTSDRAVDAVLQAIELAADLGRIALSLNLPPWKDGDSEAGQILTIATVLGTHSEKFGVALANHTAPHPRVLDANMGVGIDPAAWISQGQDPSKAMLTHAAQLVSVRLCDVLHSGLRSPVGNKHEGQLDLTQYRVAVSVAQFRGPIVLDARQWNDPWSGLEQSREAWTEANVS